MAPMASRLLMGDPVLTCGFLESSSSALAFDFVHLFLWNQCPVFWFQPISKAQKPSVTGVLCWRGVSLWFCLSGVAEPLSLLEAFQASVSSWGSLADLK